MEKTVIQSVGFRNVVEDGKVIGFQFKVRNPYYRGVYLSQVQTGYATIDGEDIGRDDIMWRVGGITYTWQDMLTCRNVHWNPLQLATIIVKKPGGLKQGFHDLRYSFTSTKSYMPPMMNVNNALRPDTTGGSGTFSEFGATHHYRRLIIV
jgi:hypothetical protein